MMVMMIGLVRLATVIGDDGDGGDGDGGCVDEWAGGYMSCVRLCRSQRRQRDSSRSKRKRTVDFRSYDIALATTADADGR